MIHNPIDILYVEDETYDITILQETLKSTPDFQNTYNLITTSDLFSGLDYLQSEAVDLVLLDMNLPEGSGKKNVEIVRKTAPHIPIVCLTSMNCEQMAMEALEAGAQEYIVKGFCNAYIMNRIIRSSIFRKNIENQLTRAACDNANQAMAVGE